MHTYQKKKIFHIVHDHLNPLQTQLLLAATFHWKIFIGFSRFSWTNWLTMLMKMLVSDNKDSFSAYPPSNAMLHFFTVTAVFCHPISMQPNHQQINNVPQRTLLSLWISSTHGCAAAHTLIIFSLSISFFSPSPFLVCQKFFLILRSFTPSPLSLFSALFHTQRSAAFLFPTPLVLFFLPHSHPFLPPSFSHLSDLNTCIMHGEGKAVRRPACANNAPK